MNNFLGTLMYHDRDYLLNNKNQTDVHRHSKSNYYIVKDIKKNGDGTLTVTTNDDRLIDIGVSDGKQADIKIGETLRYDEHGNLQVNTVSEVEMDNTLPVTSSAVAVEIGNINVLLKAI